jgi:hypothetical protein
VVSKAQASAAGGSGELEPFEPSAEDLDGRRDAMGFPRKKDATDRRADAADVAEFYRLNPGA